MKSWPWTAAQCAFALVAFSIALPVGSGRCQGDEDVNWSSEVMQLPRAQGGGKPVLATAITLHPLGRWLAVGGDDHRIYVFDLPTRSVARTLTGHTDWVRTLSYSADGRWLASAGNDRRVLLWDADTGRLAQSLPSTTSAVAQIALDTAAEQLFVIGFSDVLHVVNVRRGTVTRELHCPSTDMRAIALTPAGDLIAAGGRNGAIRVWHAATGQEAGEFVPHRQRVRGLAFSPDGELLASCGEDRALVLTHWRTDESRSRSLGECKGMCLTFCGPDRLAVGGSDNSIILFDLEQEAPCHRLTGHTGSVMSLDFNGEVLASTGFDTTVRVWRREQNLVRDPGNPNGTTVGVTRPRP